MTKHSHRYGCGGGSVLMIERRKASSSFIERALILIRSAANRKLIFLTLDSFFCRQDFARPGCARAPAGSPLANLARHEIARGASRVQRLDLLY